MRSKRSGILLFAALFVQLASLPARCWSVAAVLSAGSGPYIEAFNAFQQEYGRSVTVYDLSKGTAAPQADVVVVFGGKAALLPWPETVRLVYCVAPGVTVKTKSGGRVSVVSMLPEPSAAIAAVLQIQPGLKRLAVFSSGTYDDYLTSLAAAGKRAGIKVLHARIRDNGDIPEELRRLHGAMDAFWLLPDPRLVDTQNFTTMTDYSRANRIPFFAPAAGLARKGAMAAVYNDFGEMGRAAARVVEGGVFGGTVYPARVSYSINVLEAGRIGVSVPENALTGAEVIFK